MWVSHLNRHHTTRPLVLWDRYESLRLQAWNKYHRRIQRFRYDHAPISNWGYSDPEYHTICFWSVNSCPMPRHDANIYFLRIREPETTKRSKCSWDFPWGFSPLVMAGSNQCHLHCSKTNGESSQMPGLQYGPQTKPPFTSSYEKGMPAI